MYMYLIHALFLGNHASIYSKTTREYNVQFLSSSIEDTLYKEEESLSSSPSSSQSHPLDLSETSRNVILGVDERFPILPETNYTELINLRRIYEYAKLIKILEDQYIDINYRAELANECLEAEEPKPVNILAGGLMKDWSMSIGE